VSSKLVDSDKELLSVYDRGFKDELSGIKTSDVCPGISSTLNSKELITRAYKFGGYGAIVGDDVSSCDTQSPEEILIMIKKS